jgi:hypothetical protein
VHEPLRNEFFRGIISRRLFAITFKLAYAGEEKKITDKSTTVDDGNHQNPG